MALPEVVAVLGAGEIGSGWAALFAAHGVEVRVADPLPDALLRIDRALATIRTLGGGGSKTGAVKRAADPADAARGVQWIQESITETRGAKQRLYAEIAPMVGDECVVASSSSTFLPTPLAADLPFADRFLVVHPLHPVFAVPVVELCAGARTSSATVRRARQVMTALGREPIVVGRELPGFVAHRLTAALLREAFDLVARDVISAADLDHLVRRGIALGWAAAGPIGTETIASGGFAAFLERFEQPLGEIWGSLAAWDSLDGAMRAALLERIERSASPPLMHDAHTADLDAWALVNDRIARAARGVGQDER